MYVYTVWNLPAAVNQENENLTKKWHKTFHMEEN